MLFLLLLLLLLLLPTLLLIEFLLHLDMTPVLPPPLPEPSMARTFSSSTLAQISPRTYQLTPRGSPSSKAGGGVTASLCERLQAMTLITVGVALVLAGAPIILWDALASDSP